MNPREQALAITASGQELLGVLSLPPEGAVPHPVAVVVVVGGGQYRVGSHRQFVLLARRLAAAGHPVLRFDLRGMGDVPGEPRAFHESAGDIGSAIGAVCAAVPAAQRVVLWGLCDGASAALLYLDATRDARVSGLCLVNPWVPSQASQARAQVRHYYRQRLASAAFWRKLLRGGVGRQAVRDLWGSLRRQYAASPPDEAAVPQRMARAWRQFPGAVLLLLSERDMTAQTFAEHARNDPAWAGSLARPGLEQHTVAGADHTCSSSAARRAVEDWTLDWLRGR